jgi:hypothetical protein
MYEVPTKGSEINITGMKEDPKGRSPTNMVDNLGNGRTEIRNRDL